MRRLIALNAFNRESGISLLETTIVVVITAVATALVAPNLLGSWRQSQANQAFSELKGAIQQTQANANRQSITCTLTIAENTDDYTISGSPAGCLLETITLDKDIVSITSSATGPPWNVSFTFEGTTTNLGTFLIVRRDWAGNAIQETGKCIVIANGLGMVRTGIYAPDNTITPNDANSFPDCVNVENLRYDNES